MGYAFVGLFLFEAAGQNGVGCLQLAPSKRSVSFLDLSLVVIIHLLQYDIFSLLVMYL